MAKFLHLADIHLGFNRYNSPERTKDFFRCFQDVVQRYAIDEAVDFVLIAGDLFEHRTIQPATLNQAQLCLGLLKAANIPVLAIEGNHDNRPYGTRTSWLKYLSEWQLLQLLEPEDPKDNSAFYTPWCPKTRRGGYIDLPCGVRVAGSSWYGATAVQAIGRIAEALAQLPPGPAHTVLMFHHGLEGYVARYSGALRYGDLLPLQQAGVDYLALGHIHKHYSVGDWVFNPGSLEANNVEESTFQRGALLVTIQADSTVVAELKTDYSQRPIHRLTFTVPPDSEPDSLPELVLTHLKTQNLVPDQPPERAPIIELKLQGQVNFDPTDLPLRDLQQHLQQATGALIFLLKPELEGTAYSSPFSEGQSRQSIEHDIFLDLLAAHRDYRQHSDMLARGLVELKTQQLAGAPEPQLYELARTLLDSDPLSPQELEKE